MRPGDVSCCWYLLGFTGVAGAYASLAAVLLFATLATLTGMALADAETRTHQ